MVRTASDSKDGTIDWTWTKYIVTERLQKLEEDEAVERRVQERLAQQANPADVDL